MQKTLQRTPFAASRLPPAGQNKTRLKQKKKAKNKAREDVVQPSRCSSIDHRGNNTAISYRGSLNVLGVSLLHY